MTGLVILDRDGVINEDSDAYIKSLDEWRPLPRSIEAIARLSRAGWQVAIATNQSGIGRGYYDLTTLHDIHSHLSERVERAGGSIALITYCPHLPDDGCDCRKPKPGMIFEIQQSLGIASLEQSWMVGDSLRDIQAGQAAGCLTALVETGKGADTLAKLPRSIRPDWLCADLAEFADRLV
ncbi:D-glycero-beta-D-manno-heptose-1,7-bisphosphate 7-phosphatase [Salinicola sp. MH3R3-1]|uniref:D-glycero-beta-D-manno-heptose 1,7-bisphosphate 7-phosphatase n=1 Tax=Salinicola sp. MH3R3-1 TaxID=1928762 RepID=UPI00094E7558|nr:D-glycero-beta-D-manno-heptose 1,7-bisphosphate 7-phosphatase [Salinicola sp. MH3R3-1]OLO08679.1 D-glycero-beta-D-manno-heptose-1,7-bisphosphate 7-phosphatase [Salinicola sp. MH3R3-1]